MRVYHYPNCSTCKRALRFLETRKVPFEPIDIVDSPPSRSELRGLIQKGVQLKRLFNTSGQLYREMKLGEKLPSLSEAEALELLGRHGKLVKRPFVPEAGLVGFQEDEWKRAFPRG